MFFLLPKSGLEGPRVLLQMVDALPKERYKRASEFNKGGYWKATEHRCGKAKRFIWHKRGGPVCHIFGSVCHSFCRNPLFLKDFHAI